MINDSVVMGDQISPRGASGKIPPGPLTTALVRQVVAEQNRQRLTARELAARLGGAWSPSILTIVRGGRAAPGVELLACMAEALGLRLAVVPTDRVAAEAWFKELFAEPDETDEGR